MKRFIGNLGMSKKLMIAPLIATLFLVLLAAVSYNLHLPLVGVKVL